MTIYRENYFISSLLSPDGRATPSGSGARGAAFIAGVGARTGYAQG
jgi:hypothetical protein